MYKFSKIFVILSLLFQVVLANPLTAEIDYQYLGNSASNDDRRGWFNETQGIANGDPRAGDPYWYFSKNTDGNRNTYIYKVPYTQHLAHNFEYSKRKIRLPGGSKICKHIGDLDYHVYRGKGYLVAPYEDCGDNLARIAFFRAKDFNGSEETLKPWVVLDVSRVQGKGAPWVSVAPNGRIYSSAGGSGQSDVVFEYSIDWEQIRLGKNPSFADRALRLYDQNGKPLSLPYKQGADFSKDGGRIFISTGYSNKTFKGIWVLTHKRGRFILEHKSNNAKLPFKYETNYNNRILGGKQEPQGVSYYNLDAVTPYHNKMQRGQLHAVLLNNKIGDDAVWIKHYKEINNEESSTSNESPQFYSEIKQIAGRCLDVAGGINKNKTNVQLYTCNKTKSQKWGWTKNGEIKSIMGLCLDVSGGKNINGTNIQLYKCNGSKSQKWRKKSGDRIENIMGRCLDLAGGINANKTNIQLYYCNNTDAQKWK